MFSILINIIDIDIDIDIDIFAIKFENFWKINFLLPVGFEPTTSGFRDQRLNRSNTGDSWLRTNHTELLCINGIMWYNHLEASTLQGSQETIWHIIEERKTFEVQFSIAYSITYKSYKLAET